MADIQRVERWVIAVLLAALAIFAGTRWYQGQRAVKKADKIDKVVVEKTEEGKKHEADAADDHKQTQTDDALGDVAEELVRKLKARVAALEKAAKTPPPAMTVAPVVPEDPSHALVITALNQLVAAEDAQHDIDLKRIADRDKELKDQAAATTSWKQAAQASQSEVVQLRAAAAASSTRWGVGALYGTSGTAGGYVERGFGPVQVGVSVVRHAIAGGQTTLEAVASAGIRF